MSCVLTILLTVSLRDNSPVSSEKCLTSNVARTSRRSRGPLQAARVLSKMRPNEKRNTFQVTNCANAQEIAQNKPCLAIYYMAQFSLEICSRIVNDFPSS